MQTDLGQYRPPSHICLDPTSAALRVRQTEEQASEDNTCFVK
jgi:hypothetical protein